MSSLHEWRKEEDLYIVRSLIGSVVEFKERCSKSQKKKVVGIVYKCDNNSFNLVDTEINGSYFGDYFINDYEIKKWRLIEYIKREKKQRSVTNSERVDTRTKYVIPNEFEKDFAENEGEDDVIRRYDHIIEEEPEVIDLNEDDQLIDIDVDSLPMKASNDIIFVETIDENFREIIPKIFRYHSIGFGVFGEEVSRDGSIDLMAFATPDAIYVFDTYSCNKKSELISYLKTILESKDIQKVMYSVRKASDALFHLFGIKVDNVMDVKIWDFGLLKKNFLSNKISEKPDFRSLETIVFKHLGIKLPNIWQKPNFKRHSNSVQNYIRFKTIFLNQLFVIINRKVLEDLYIMNSKAVRSLRSSSNLEFLVMKNDERELEIIDKPMSESDEMEKLIKSAAYSNGFKGKEIIIDSKEEIIIDSDEELDEIMVRSKTKKQ